MIAGERRWVGPAEQIGRDRSGFRRPSDGRSTRSSEGAEPADLESLLVELADLADRTRRSDRQLYLWVSL